MSYWLCKCYKSSYTHLQNTVCLLDLRGRNTHVYRTVNISVNTKIDYINF